MNPSSTSTAENRIAAANAAAAAAASNRPFTSPTQPPRPSSVTTIPQPRHSYQYPQQQKQPLFAAQSHSTITTTRHPNPNPNPSLRPQFHRPHVSSQPQQQPPPHQSIPYPVVSSGRGFIHRPLRPQPPDQTVTVANPGAYPPRPVVTFPHQVVRSFGFSGSDSLNQPVHMIRPPYVQHPNFAVTSGAVLAPIRGIPVSAHPKVASSPSPVSACNGYKELRGRSREDTFVTIRDRKVRITDGASLYALCRSWLRNGSYEERQPQNGDGAKCLPRPLPIPVAGSHLPTKKEVEEDEDEENVRYVQHLSAEELLQRHIQRAKRVRARLREVRLQRIARYKARLATLLPPPVEQFAEDTTA